MIRHLGVCASLLFLRAEVASLDAGVGASPAVVAPTPTT